jgi:hypothetical protein
MKNQYSFYITINPGMYISNFYHPTEGGTLFSPVLYEDKCLSQIKFLVFYTPARGTKQSEQK